VHIDFLGETAQLIRVGKQRPFYGHQIMKQSYGPQRHPASQPPLFLIGRNGCGRWVVREQSGRSGGVFIDRNEAIKFAMFECSRSPQSVVMVPGLLELDLGAPKASGKDRQ
jgi:hypothetical protein